MATGKVSVIAREWVPLVEAMKALGKSQKTIERLIAAGELRSQLEPRAGRKPERMYHAGDLDRIRQHSITVPAAEPKRKQQLAIASDAVTTVRDVVTRWLDRAERVGVRERLWLNLEEAQAYSGLARNDLLALCREGKLTARKSGGWRIRRASLEEFAG